MKNLPIEDIKKFHEKLTNARKITIVSHTYPDGDSIGGCMAMLSWLKSIGADATAIILDKYPEYLDFLLDESVAKDIIVCERDEEKTRKTVLESDLILFLDMNNSSRAGAPLTEMLNESKAEKIVIDHHPDPDRDYFSIAFSETNISSTCELIYYILKAMLGEGCAADLPRLTATALMTGMTTDTNNFGNSTFPTTFVMASELLAAGIDRERILDHVLNSYRENRIRLMGRLFDNYLKITDDGVAYIILTRRICRQFDFQIGETDGFVNIPLTIKKVRLSLFLTEEKGRFRVSVRSKDGVSSNRLCNKYFHGGGHEKAAGGRLMIPADVRGVADAANYVEASTHKFFMEELKNK